MAQSKINLAVLVSGSGSNFQAIADSVRKKELAVNLALLISDNPQAFVLKRAENAGVKSVVINREDYSSKREFEDEIIRVLKENRIDLIVMAGFMRMVSPQFVGCYKNRILNIHPSLLPSFKGADAIKDAFEYGAKVTGVTVHFIDEEMDHGPIIVQAAVEIKEKDTLETLEEKIHAQEHKLYPFAIKLFIEGKYKIYGRKVKILFR